MNLHTFLVWECITRNIKLSLRDMREATSKRERASHLRSVVRQLDALDAALGR